MCFGFCEVGYLYLLVVVFFVVMFVGVGVGVGILLFIYGVFNVVWDGGFGVCGVVVDVGVEIEVVYNIIEYDVVDLVLVGFVVFVILFEWGYIDVEVVCIEVFVCVGGIVVVVDDFRLYGNDLFV